jgi:hypothetical protein
MKATVTNTAGILYLAENSKGRNRSVDGLTLMETVDPKGMHVLSFSLPHNDVEMRTMWLCKMKDSNEPQTIWLDVDFDALRECTTDIDTNNKEVENGK